VRCGQHLVPGIILKHLSKYPQAEVLWSQKVFGIEQDEESVIAICGTENGEKVKITGEYRRWGSINSEKRKLDVRWMASRTSKW